MKRFSKKEIFSIPNLMGYFRILLIPVFCYLYITAETEREYLYAALVVLLSSLTDLFDGKIARRFHMVTELGKALDPIADKLTHAALAICLATRYPMMWALIALMLVKEGYMGVMGLIFLKKGKMLDGAMWFGKVCTAVLFAGLLVLFLFSQLEAAVVNGIIMIMMGIMIVTLCMYVPVFQKMKHKGEKKMAKNKYYAVRKGRIPGIYRTWSECQKQVTGYPGAVFKGFVTEEEAQSFLHPGAEREGKRDTYFSYCLSICLCGWILFSGGLRFGVFKTV